MYEFRTTVFIFNKTGEDVHVGIISKFSMCYGIIMGNSNSTREIQLFKLNFMNNCRYVDPNDPTRIFLQQPASESQLRRRAYHPQSDETAY
jgi:hypothetical protein